METTQNGSFTNAFLQGLVVVFFLYVVLFNVSILMGKKSHDVPAVLASASIDITREETVLTPTPEPVSIETAPQPLQSSDEVPAPDAATQAAMPPDEKEFIEMTDNGPMPKRSPDGATVFETFKHPFKDEGRPAIALAILDYGLSESNSKEALKKLPPEVSFILNPYAETADTWKSLAHEGGHEFWMFMPVENEIYPEKADPGPQALLAHSDFKYNQEKYIWDLTRTTGYVGIAAFTDGAFLNAQSALKTLWNESYDRGLGYFEVNPNGLEGIEMNAVEKKAPYVKNNTIFDEFKQSVDEWLASLEQQASNNGYAVGIIRNPYPNIIDSIAAWGGTVKDHGFSLAPVSALAQIKSDTPVPASSNASP